MAEIKTGIFAKNVQKRLNRAQEKVRADDGVGGGGGAGGDGEMEDRWRRTGSWLEAAGLSQII